MVDVPEKDVWWTREPYETDLKEALAWAKENPPEETSLDELLLRASAASKQLTKPSGRRVRSSTREG